MTFYCVRSAYCSYPQSCYDGLRFIVFNKWCKLTKVIRRLKSISFLTIVQSRHLHKILSLHMYSESCTL